MSVATDPIKTGFNVFGVGTWANVPASAPTWAQYFATDVGENGTLFQWNGTRWRVVNGQSSLKSLGAATGNIANVETIVLQASIPAGAWQTNDVIRLRNLSMSKSGAVDTGNITIRIGTAGTTADTALTGVSALPVMVAASQSYGGEFDVKLVSATSALKLGNGGTTAFAGGGTGAAAAATAITSAATNALFVTLTLASSGATNTVAMQSGQILLVTP